MTSQNAQEEMTKKVENEGIGTHKVNYRIRDWVFSRQRYWGEPFPLMYTLDGQIIPDKNLPVLLPDVPDYKPTSDAVSPLEKNQEWVNTTTPDGKPAKRETSTMPNWAGSCWYFIRYLDPHNDQTFADMEKMKYWLPVDRYFGGAEHTTMHLLYSRFWYKFFYDLGLVPTSEPYNWRLNGGLMLGPDGHKMSKSLGNIVDPMLVADNYGADALKLFIAFTGPYEDTYPWNETGIKSTFRLINTIYELRNKVSGNVTDPALEKAFHKMLKNLSGMVENLKMNTAVSEIMIFINQTKKVAKIDKALWKNFVKSIAPFTPFLAEELWQEANGYSEWSKENSVHSQKWPEFDVKLTVEEKITVPVQINGKVKGEIELEGTESEDEIRSLVLGLPIIGEQIQGKNIEKVIYIPRKIISIVLK
jgi:leucyl-tRNA synthetase